MATRNISSKGHSGTGNPALSPLRNGQPARKAPIESVAKESSEVFCNTVRTLLSIGMHGAESMQIPSDDLPTEDQVYPLKTRETVVCRRPPIRLTPGCFPTVRGLALPSGPCSKFFFAIDKWVYDGSYGQIKLSADYDNGVDTSTVEQIIDIPSSDNADNKETTSAGAAWAEFIPFECELIPGFVASQYMDGATVEITVSYLGAPRVVDLGIYELAIQYSRNTATDPDEWINPIVDTAALPSQYPIEELSSTDPFYGSKLLADAAARQQRELGPLLMEWSAWSETDVSVTAAECPGINITSTSFVDLRNTSLTGWASTHPGWSVSSGGSAQQFNTSNHLVEMRALDAVVPVRCWVWGSRSVSGTSVVRFQTQLYSICEVLITSSTAQWWSATGHLRCGIGAEDASVLEILCKASTGSTLNIKHLAIEYLDT